MLINALGDRLLRPLRRVRGLDGQSGTTLIEMMVSLAAGLIVFGSIAALLLMTIRQSGRVTSHVEANQRARTAMTKIVNELNSACFFPKIDPVREKSGDNKLIFWHQSGEAVAPTPIQSTIELTNGELIQRNEDPLPGGGGDVWKFPNTGGTTEYLMKGVGPLEEAGPIFTYYSYTAGKISSTPLPTGTEGLSGTNAGATVQVNIGFRSAPEPPISNDEHSATAVRNAVLLRLTPPSYNSANANRPCE